MYLNYQTILPAAAALLSLCLGLFALLKAKDLLAYRLFALGMLLLASEQVFSLLIFHSGDPVAFLHWQFINMLAGALAPATWLAFSICYVREDFRQSLLRWKWGLIAAAIFPTALIWLFRGSLFRTLAFKTGWVVSFGWPGYLYELIVLLVIITILVRLERTLRASSGDARWRIKFMVLGIGFIFAARIYSTAERLLFVGDFSFLFLVDSATLLLGDLMVIVGFMRTRLENVNVYISQDLLYNSIVITLVGAYLLIVGVAAKIARYFGAGAIMLDDVFLILITLLGIAVLLLSDSVRFRIRNFISRNFQRPPYDYRKVWASFTERLPSMIDLRDLSNAMARTISETFGIACVSIWVNDEIRGAPALSGSTHLPANSEPNPELQNEIGFLALSSRDKRTPMMLDSPARKEGGWSYDRIYCCAPLMAKGEFLGLITLGSKINKEDYNAQDLDLLTIIAQNAAGLILNHKLFQNRQRHMEMEAFRAMSSFLAHDLKNVASTISLTLTSFPVHYQNPEFRADALQMMSKTVEKIRKICSGLSALDQKFELEKSPCDLNELVTATLAGLELSTPVITDLSPVPKTLLDPEQIQKVVLNLVLNAFEASDNGNEIQVATRCEGPWLRISVTDHGCGMSGEFMNKELFHPFRTTKKNGSGIGLYQGKTIVEAHGGHIEVQSTKGEGSIFSVFLPLAG
ncbi:MAG: XrtA/PEP-CTERM system histidine kinase PrsK [Syntrophobacteraceae bacterium]